MNSRPRTRAGARAFAVCLLMLSSGLSALVAPPVLASGDVPSPPPLTDADIQRFVNAWMARLNETGWLERYLQSGPLVHIDDGFNAYDNASKQLLLGHLRDAWEDAVPALHEKIFGDDPAPEVLAARQQNVTQLLYLITFNKVGLVQYVLGAMGLGAPPGVPTPPKGPGSIDGGDPTSILADMTEAQRDGLAKNIAAYRKEDTLRIRNTEAEILNLSAQDVNSYSSQHPFNDLTQSPVIHNVDPVQLQPWIANTATHGWSPPTVQVTEAVLRPQPVPSADLPLIDLQGRNLSAMIGDVGFPPLPGLLPALPLELPLRPPGLPTLDLTLPPPPVALPGPAGTLLATAQGLLNRTNALLVSTLAAATFDICWQRVGGAVPRCQAAPAAFNAPTTLDLNGDGVPDGALIVGGPASATGRSTPAVTITWKRTDLGATTAPAGGASLGDLPYLLTVRARFPSSDLHAVLGLDGRKDTLPDHAALTFTLDPRAQLQRGNVDAVLHLVAAPGVDDLGLLAGTLRARALDNGTLVYFDPSITLVHARPAPATLTLGVGLDTVARLVNGTAAPGGSVRLGFDADIPTTLTAEFVRQDTAAGVTSEVAAAVTLDPLPFTANATLNLTAARNEAPFTVDFDVGAPGPNATFDLAAVPDLAAPGDYRAEHLALVEAPATMRAAANLLPGQGMHLTHRSSGPVGAAAATYAVVARGVASVAAAADLTQLPRQIDVDLTLKGNLLLDLDAAANGPVGSARFLLLDGANATVQAPGGDHFAATERLSPEGDALRGVSAQLAGLRSLHYHEDSPDAARFSLTQDGTAPFTIVASADRIAAGSDLTQIVLPGVPPTLELDVERSLAPADVQVSFAAPTGLASLGVARRSLRSGDNVDFGLTVQPLPAQFDLDASLPEGGPVRAIAHASSPVENLVLAALHNRTAERQEVRLAAQDFDREVRTDFDPGAGTWEAATTGKTVGSLTTDVTLHGSRDRGIHAEATGLAGDVLATWGAVLGAQPVTLDASPALATLVLGVADGGPVQLPPVGTGDYLGVLREGSAANLAARFVTPQAVRLDPTKTATGDALLSARLGTRAPLDVVVSVPGGSLSLSVEDAPRNLSLAQDGVHWLATTDGAVDRLQFFAQRDAPHAEVAVTASRLGAGDSVLDTTTGKPAVRIPGGVGRLQVTRAEGTAVPGFIAGDQDGYVVHRDGQGNLLALQLTNATAFAAQLALTHLHLDATRAAPFFVAIAVPDLIFDLFLSSQPGNVSVDLEEATHSLDYRADGPIAAFAAEARFAGNHVATVVTGVPALVHERWGGRALEVLAPGGTTKVVLGATLPASDLRTPAIGPVGLFVDVRGLASSLNLTWGQGLVETKAGNVPSYLVAEVQDAGTGLATRLHADQPARHMKLTYDNAGLHALAEPEAAATLEAWVRKAAPTSWTVDPNVPGSGSPDYQELSNAHAMFQLLAGSATSQTDTTTRFFASVRAHHIHSLDLSGSGTELNSQVKQDTPEAFVGYFLDRVAAATAGFEGFYDVHDIPSSFSVRFDPAQGTSTYAASAAVDSLETDVRPLHAPAWARLVLGTNETSGNGVPLSYTLAWGQDPPSTNYEAVGPTGLWEFEAYARNLADGNETGILANAEDIPHHMDFALIDDSLAVNGSLPEEPAVQNMHAYIKQAPPVCNQPGELGPQSSPLCLEAYDRLAATDVPPTELADSSANVAISHAQSHSMTPHAVTCPTDDISAAQSLAESQSMVKKPGGKTQAAFEYQGFKSLRMEFSDYQVRVLFENDCAQRFRTFLTLHAGPFALEGYVDMNKIPAKMTFLLDLKNQNLEYHASDVWKYMLFTGALAIPGLGDYAQMNATFLLEQVPKDIVLHFYYNLAFGIEYVVLPQSLLERKEGSEFEKYLVQYAAGDAQNFTGGGVPIPVKTEAKGVLYHASSKFGRIFAEFNAGPLGVMAELRGLGSTLRFELQNKYLGNSQVPFRQNVTLKADTILPTFLDGNFTGEWTLARANITDDMPDPAAVALGAPWLSGGSAAIPASFHGTFTNATGSYTGDFAGTFHGNLTGTVTQQLDFDSANHTYNQTVLTGTLAGALLAPRDPTANNVFESLAETAESTLGTKCSFDTSALSWRNAPKLNCLGGSPFDNAPSSYAGTVPDDLTGDFQGNGLGEFSDFQRNATSGNVMGTFVGTLSGLYTNGTNQLSGDFTGTFTGNFSGDFLENNTRFIGGFHGTLTQGSLAAPSDAANTLADTIFVAVKIGFSGFQSTDGDGLYFNASAKSLDPTDLGIHAAFRISGLKGLLTEADMLQQIFAGTIQMAGGENFSISLEGGGANSHFKVLGWIDEMPQHINVIYNGQTGEGAGAQYYYNGDNFNLTLRAEFGPPLLLGLFKDPDLVHGVNIKFSPFLHAMKVALWITGMPTQIAFQAGQNIQYYGFHPAGAHTEQVSNPQRVEADGLVNNTLSFLRTNPLYSGLLGGMSDAETRQFVIGYLLQNCLLPQSPDDMPHLVNRSLDGLPLVVRLYNVDSRVQLLLRMENLPQDFNGQIGANNPNQPDVQSAEFGLDPNGVPYASIVLAHYAASSDFGPISLSLTAPILVPPVPIPEDLVSENFSVGFVTMEFAIKTLPQAMELRARFGAPTGLEIRSQGEQLDGVIVGLKLPAYSTTKYIAAVEVDHVPHDMVLGIDPDALGTGVTTGVFQIVHYLADESTLTIRAYIDINVGDILKAEGGALNPGLGRVMGDIAGVINLKVNISLELDNLGKDTEVDFVLPGIGGCTGVSCLSPKLRVLSSPETCRIALDATVLVTVDIPDAGFDLSLFDILQVGFHLGFHAEIGIKNFQFELLHLSSMDLGITIPALTVSNFHGYFHVGWDFIGIELRIHLHVYAKVYIDLPIIPTIDITLFDLDRTFTPRLTLDVVFMTFIDNPSKGNPSLFYQKFDVGITDVELRIEGHPREIQRTLNSFTLSSLPSDPSNLTGVRPNMGDNPNAMRYIAFFPTFSQWLPSFITDYIDIDALGEAIIKVAVVLFNGGFGDGGGSGDPGEGMTAAGGPQTIKDHGDLNSTNHVTNTTTYAVNSTANRLSARLVWNSTQIGTTVGFTLLKNNSPVNPDNSSTMPMGANGTYNANYTVAGGAQYQAKVTLSAGTTATFNVTMVAVKT